MDETRGGYASVNFGVALSENNSSLSGMLQDENASPSHINYMDHQFVSNTGDINEQQTLPLSDVPIDVHLSSDFPESDNAVLTSLIYQNDPGNESNFSSSLFSPEEEMTGNSSVSCIENTVEPIAPVYMESFAVSTSEIKSDDVGAPPILFQGELQPHQDENSLIECNPHVSGKVLYQDITSKEEYNDVASSGFKQDEENKLVPDGSVSFGRSASELSEHPDMLPSHKSVDDGSGVTTLPDDLVFGHSFESSLHQNFNTDIESSTTTDIPCSLTLPFDTCDEGASVIDGSNERDLEHSGSKFSEGSPDAEVEQSVNECLQEIITDDNYNTKATNVEGFSDAGGANDSDLNAANADYFPDAGADHNLCDVNAISVEDSEEIGDGKEGAYAEYLPESVVDDVNLPGIKSGSENVNSETTSKNEADSEVEDSFKDGVNPPGIKSGSENVNSETTSKDEADSEVEDSFKDDLNLPGIKSGSENVNSETNSKDEADSEVEDSFKNPLEVGMACEASEGAFDGNGSDVIQRFSENIDGDMVQKHSLISEANLDDSEDLETTQTLNSAVPMYGDSPVQNCTEHEGAVKAGLENDPPVQDRSEIKGTVMDVAEDNANVDVQLKQETDIGSDEEGKERDEVKEASPMICMMDSSLVEDLQEESKKTLEQKAEEQSNTAKTGSVRVTRLRSGIVPTKPNRLVCDLDTEETDDSLSDAQTSSEWEFVEGAESAPSVVDPSITVPECVLRVTPEEMKFYNSQFPCQDSVLKMMLHCTVCGKHMGAAPNNIQFSNQHKVLRVLICNRCRSFYGKGKFPRDSDGSELYCRWCGQGGQVICCSHCPNVFCKSCLRRNFGPAQLKLISDLSDWSCLICNYQELWKLRGICWALLGYVMRRKRDALATTDDKKLSELNEDQSTCCGFKNHKRKKSKNKGKPASSNASNGVRNSLPLPNVSHEDFMSGHFLFDHGDNTEDHLDSDANNIDYESELPAADEDFDADFDPSQFVQPVLEEEPPSIPAGKISMPFERSTNAVRQFRRIAPAPSLSAPRFQSPRAVAPLRQAAARPFARILTQCRPVNMHTLNQPPRLLIRQGGIMQPGLVPINKQVNSLTAGNPPVVVVNDTSKPPTLVPRSQSSSIHSMDGVRSLEQLQSLSTVDWFRDGIDNMRSVGYAIVKRVRELEARFHSLKHKSDIDKVMVLGKKLERLARRTQLRYSKINSELKQGCVRWYNINARRQGRSVLNFGNINLVDPFHPYNEPHSDWDDDAELSKPLEKVLIPVNASALKGSNPRIIANFNVRPSTPRMPSVPTPPLRTFGPRSATAPARAMGPRIATPAGARDINIVGIQNTFQRFKGNQMPSVAVQNIPAPNNVRPRMITSSLLTPALSPYAAKEGSLMKYLNNANIVDSIGNTVSITVTSSKRKRNDSDGDSDSDAGTYPSIPELIELYNVRPCNVQLERCDELIASILQEQADKYNVDDSDDDSLCSIVCDTSEKPVSRESIVFSTFCDVNSAGGVAVDNDDDIQIIE